MKRLFSTAKSSNSIFTPIKSRGVLAVFGKDATEII